ncbi:DUF3375 family protein [Microbacterium sp. DT81.1]|uniref:DUF3375 family protein n=1 Tax=Microbacterium sp. DT81.1 TaxID=3393413 RepID=UPI003CEEC5D2
MAGPKDSGIHAELERVRAAYGTPVLSLLNSRTSDFQIAAMRSVFGTSQASPEYSVVASRLDEVIALVPDDERPQKDGRQLIAAWLDDRLLRSDDGDGGIRTLTLTSAALGALRFVDDQTNVRPLLGESRVTAITEIITALAAHASGSVEARKEQLREQIAVLTIELERLEAGGTLEGLSTDEIIDRTSHLLDMTGTLPEQFTKVAEAIRSNHKDVAARLRADDIPQGQIAREYLTAHDGLAATAEGRAYSSATEILRSEDRLARMGDEIAAILAHPSAEVLTAAERTGLARLESDLMTGIDVVRTEHRRVTNTFSRYLRSADPNADRAVARLLRDANVGLQTWMATAGARENIDLVVGNQGSLDLGRLPVSWPNPDDYAPPAAPTTDPGSRGAPISLAELKALGGPRTRAVLDKMPALARQHGARTLGTVFAHLPEDLTRPVELVGLIAEARAVGARIGADQTEAVISRRDDGSTRTLIIPLIHLTDDGELELDRSDMEAAL